jgi:hypothetical protein
MYKQFMKYHASSTKEAWDYAKLALSQNDHYADESDVDGTTNAVVTLTNVIAPQINNNRPVICGIKKAGGLYDHAFVIYGFTLPQTVKVADPAFSDLGDIPVATIQQGYNGDPNDQWVRLIFTKPS